MWNYQTGGREVTGAGERKDGFSGVQWIGCTCVLKHTPSWEETRKQ